MKFFDTITIKVRSGRGGDGSSAGRREAYVAYGGPSGGDGGDGGNVIITASHNEYTLMAYKTNTIYKAQNGEHGKGKDLYGKAGEDKYLVVPVGSRITDTYTGELLASLDHDGASVQIVQGGRGGLGNKHFVNAAKQRSTIALLGEPARQREITIELQLLADVGLVGAPSVGKSSLINTVSNTKAKVAEYHFTTLVPNLGVISHREKSFTMIDIPGLIAGAGEGKGLGSDFLRHVRKSSLLALTLDVSRYESGIQEALQLLTERTNYLDLQYGPGEHTREYQDDMIVSTSVHDLETVVKKRCVVVSKSDLLVDDALRDEYQQTFLMMLNEYLGLHIITNQLQKMYFQISSATREGIDDLLDYCLYHLDPVTVVEAGPVQQIDDEMTVVCEPVSKEIKDYLIEEEYLPVQVLKKNEVRDIHHPEITHLTFVLPRGNDEAELRYRQRLEELRILPWLKKQGVKKGDVLQVASIYDGYDERWVRWE